jgi:hypothetical protein
VAITNNRIESCDNGKVTYRFKNSRTDQWETKTLPVFDDVEDILDAVAAGLVSIDTPGLVVLCPIISEQGADAPGHVQASEEFPPFPDTF